LVTRAWIRGPLPAAAVVLAACSTEAPLTTSPPVTTAPVPPSSSPTPSTPPNLAPQLVARVRPTPISGRAPLEVRVNLCRSSDADGDPLNYAFEFDREGKRLVPECEMRHVYAGPVRTSAVFCVSDGRLDHLVCGTYVVEVS
jgi:hypothetical protein